MNKKQTNHHSQVRRWIFLFLTTAVLITACNKNNDKNDNSFPTEGKTFKTAKAAVAGEMISKVIGPEGGNLSYDGDVMIEIPAGTVSEPVTFSIQPVKSQLQPQNGKVNYELLPHDVTFNKPVKITFSYDPSWFSSSEDALQVAYRKESGSWHSLPTELNKTTKTLTVTKNSFSEFEFFEKFILHSEKSNLSSGEQTDLMVGVIYEDYDGLLAPLVPHFQNGNDCYFLLDKSVANNISGWTVVEQTGTVTAKNNFRSIASYTAPANLTHAEATVQVRIEGIKSPISSNRTDGGSVLILRKKINLTNGYIRLTIDGKTHMLVNNLNATQFEQYSFGIAGTNEDATLDLSLAVILRGREARAGVYPFGLLESGTAIVSLFDNSSDWGSSYYDCSINTAQSSEGSVNIIKWSHNPGEMTKGNFAIKLYKQISTCESAEKTILVDFEIPRTV